jgi:hypothetical protein
MADWCRIHGTQSSTRGDVKSSASERLLPSKGIAHRCPFSLFHEALLETLLAAIDEESSKEPEFLLTHSFEIRLLSVV